MRISDWSSDVCSSDVVIVTAFEEYRMKPSSPVLVRGCALSLLVGLAIAFPGASAFAATPDLDAIRQQVEAQHDEAVKRLQDWIAMPSIAAENLNSREGAQYLAQLEIGRAHV